MDHIKTLLSEDVEDRHRNHINIFFTLCHVGFPFHTIFTIVIHFFLHHEGSLTNDVKGRCMLTLGIDDCVLSTVLNPDHIGNLLQVYIVNRTEQWHLSQLFCDFITDPDLER